MNQRSIPGLSHSRGTGLTWDQMKALDAERRRLDASHLARRVAAVTDRPEPVRRSAASVQESPNASASATATTSTSTGPQIGDAASPRGPRVIEVGKALARRAEARARTERLDALDKALDAALNQQRFSLGGQ